MKIRSAKNKGRRLQVDIRDALREAFKSKGLVEGDIECTIMGESGRDIKLSPLAEKLIPYDIEAKNQEKISLWACLEQAEINTKKERIPALVFKRNRSKTYAIIEFNEFLKLISK